MGQSPKGDSISNSKQGIEFHQGKTLFTDKYLSLSIQKTDTPIKIATANSILLSVRAPVGKVNITKRNICIGRGLCAFKTLGPINPHYLFYILKAMEQTFVKQATGTTFIAVTGKVVKNQPFPLPPLAEQQRMVTKIDKLMALCNELKTAFTTPVKIVEKEGIVPFSLTGTKEETMLAARGNVEQLSSEAMQAIDDLFAEDEE